MNIPEIEELVELHCDQLMEHVECVQILVSRCVKGKTEYSFFGKGNIFARQGMAKEFLDLDIAHTLALEINGTASDDGEDWKGK